MKLFSKIFLLLSITASAAVLKDEQIKMTNFYCSWENPNNHLDIFDMNSMA